MSPRTSRQRERVPPLRSLEPERTNLPDRLTSFVGRSSDLASLEDALASARLLTLTGTGGVGKSRLALELARATNERGRDGVWWVDLTAIDHPDLLPGYVASVLGLANSGDPEKQIAAWLEHKKTALLILDNCEHIIDSCAHLCVGLLRAAPDLVIVTTSQIPLGVEGEMLWPVPTLAENDAIALFEARARLVHPAFRVEPRNRDEIRSICRRLDDLPLAIELAASKLGTMTERQLAQQLDDRFSLLASKRSDDRRHQTMTATIDWSYRLLSEQESTLFRRLSVFRGGFSLESAVAVCRDGRLPDVPAAIVALIEKSMVVLERLDNGDARYRLLESQIAFAEEKLRGSTDDRMVHERHFSHFSDAVRVSFLESGDQSATNSDRSSQARWKRREMANLSAALRWARREHEDLGLELAGMLAFGAVPIEATTLLGWLTSLLDELIPVGSTKPHRHADVNALMLGANGASRCAFYIGDYSAALRYAQQSLDLIEVDADGLWKERKAKALLHLGDALDGLGKVDEAEAALERALELVDGSTNVKLRSNLENALGSVALAKHEFERARGILALAVSDAVATGDALPVARATESLANADLACGDVEAAERNWKKALVLVRDTHNYMAVTCIGGLARAATARNEHFRAVRLGAAYERANHELGSHGDPPYWSDELFRCLQTSRRKLGPDMTVQANDLGSKMTLDEAAEYALGQEDKADTARLAPLSRAEARVALLVPTSMTYRQIADALHLSERTVENHVANSCAKLGIRTRSELAVWVVSRGFAPPTA